MYRNKGQLIVPRQISYPYTVVLHLNYTHTHPFACCKNRWEADEIVSREIEKLENRYGCRITVYKFGVYIYTVWKTK